jgi:hypothetical protein
VRWRIRHTREVDSASLSSFERAAARFNDSDAGRTVSRLARSLGRPSVSIGASAGHRDEVRITVAWELSWYQWGVDLGIEPVLIRPLAKGSEIEQLDFPARQWNASYVEGAPIVLLAPTRRRAPGAPAHR